MLAIGRMLKKRLQCERGNFWPTATFDLQHGLEGHVMLYWSLMFLLVALVAALFGFGGIASASAGVAQVLFFLFIALFIATLIMRLVRGR